MQPITRKSSKITIKDRSIVRFDDEIIKVYQSLPLAEEWFHKNNTVKRHLSGKKISMFENICLIFGNIKYERLIFGGCGRAHRVFCLWIFENMEYLEDNNKYIPIDANRRSLLIEDELLHYVPRYSTVNPYILDLEVENGA